MRFYNQHWLHCGASSVLLTVKPDISPAWKNEALKRSPGTSPENSKQDHTAPPFRRRWGEGTFEALLCKQASVPVDENSSLCKVESWYIGAATSQPSILDIGLVIMKFRATIFLLGSFFFFYDSSSVLVLRAWFYAFSGYRQAQLYECQFRANLVLRCGTCGCWDYFWTICFGLLINLAKIFCILENYC